MKAVMYHYVREYDESFPNFRYLSYDNFCEQLDYFSANFGFLSKEEWHDLLGGHSDTDFSDEVILTFDDAMSCHYEFVFHELLKRDLWGIFYVPTKPYVDGKVLDVHRIHKLLGATDGRVLLDLAQSILGADIASYVNERFSKVTYTRQVNEPGVSEFKQLLNYYLDAENREKVLKFLELELNISSDASSFYVSKGQLKEMRDAGMVIGSHSHTHNVMSTLGENEQVVELQRSQQLLSQITGGEVTSYCHPYGGGATFNAHTFKALDELGYDHAFMVEPRDLYPRDLSHSRYSLPRFDCSHFPFGQVS